MRNHRKHVAKRQAKPVSIPFTWRRPLLRWGMLVPLTIAALDGSGCAATWGEGKKADRTPPSVSIVSPTDGATLSENVALVATASDNVGVASVEFPLNRQTRVSSGAVR